MKDWQWILITFAGCLLIGSFLFLIPEGHVYVEEEVDVEVNCTEMDCTSYYVLSGVGTESAFLGLIENLFWKKQIAYFGKGGAITWEEYCMEKGVTCEHSWFKKPS